MVWDVPFYAFMFASGLYLLYRQRQVFSQNLHNDNALVFLMHRCSREDRRDLLRSLLDHAYFFFSLPMLAALRWALRTGGAGALAWFLLFSFCLKGVEAVLPVLANFNFGRDLPDHWFLLFPGSSAWTFRKREFRFLAAILFLVWGLFFGLSLFGAAFRKVFAPPLLSCRFLWLFLCLGVLLYWPLRVRKRGKGSRTMPLLDLRSFVLPLLFGLACISMLIWNMGNLALVLWLILRDALQVKVFVFPYESRGFLPMLRAGAVLTALRFLLQLLSQERQKQELPHPAFYAAASILNTTVSTLLVFILGLAELLAAADPIGMRFPRLLFLAVAGMAGGGLLLRGFRFFRAWFSTQRRPVPLLLLLGLLLLLLLLLAEIPEAVWPGAEALADVLQRIGLGGLLTEGGRGRLLSDLLASAYFLYLLIGLRDSSWYFILLEDYRDRFVWHSTPNSCVPLHRIPDDET